MGAPWVGLFYCNLSTCVRATRLQTFFSSGGAGVAGDDCVPDDVISRVGSEAETFSGSLPVDAVGAAV